MDDSEAISLEQIRTILAGSRDLRFSGQRRAETYGWVQSTLVRHQYAKLGRADKGLLRQYVAQMTGLSRAQTARLIGSYRKTGRVQAVIYQRAKFATRYTAADIDLLAYVDKAHGNLSGPATKRILEREYADYGQAAYQQLDLAGQLGRVGRVHADNMLSLGQLNGRVQKSGRRWSSARRSPWASPGAEHAELQAVLHRPAQSIEGPDFWPGNLRVLLG